jgi:magnesium chelatase subunit I
MQERDVQIKGYRVRLPLDVLIVASANPEDYTSRGRIVTPLKDRFAAQIRTHYPQSREVELGIVAQEAKLPRVEGVQIHVPDYMKRIVVELTFQARQSPEISQGSGVSVRTSIANYETLVANAVRRALVNADGEAVPRISDLGAILSSTQGKLELEYAAGGKSEPEIIAGLVRRATKVVFDETFRDSALRDTVTGAFDRGWMVEVTDMTAPREFLLGMEKIAGLKEAVGVLAPGESAPRLAAAIEFLLEGLHLSNRLNKTVEAGRAAVYGRT